MLDGVLLQHQNRSMRVPGRRQSKDCVAPRTVEIVVSMQRRALREWVSLFPRTGMVWALPSVNGNYWHEGVRAECGRTARTCKSTDKVRWLDSTARLVTTSTASNRYPSRPKQSLAWAS